MIDFIQEYFMNLTILRVISLLGLLLFAKLTMMGLRDIWVFFFPRPEGVKQRYPFEALICIAFNLDKQLDLMTEYMDIAYTQTKKKTAIVESSFLPTLIITKNVENVQHILKDNFENYGKSGNVFKPRLQGLLGNGIFNSDGQQWYAHRKTSAHLFKMNKFKGSILDVFNDDLNQLITVINQKLQNNQPVFDIHDYMHRFTLESISRIAFGISLGCITDANINFAKDFDYCTMSINDSFINPLWLLERYLTPKGWKYFYCLFRINRYAKQIITERRKEIARGEGLEKNDLLTLYLNKDNFKDVLGNGSENATQEHLDTFMEPTDSNLRDVILNMVIAGRDTTAQALSWAFYRMCIHPETQEKLRQEAREVFSKTTADGKDGKTEAELLKEKNGVHGVGYNAIQQLKYTEAFCMEVLRFHPSVPKEGKEIFHEDTLPDGTKVYPGELISFVPWAMGRDKDLWGENALDFVPERFLDQPKPNPFKFIAFQAGPRTCLGQNFAMLEMKCVISRMVSLYELTLEQDPKTVTYDVSLTLPIKGGLKVRATVV